jgi:hypothetical protein
METNYEWQFESLPMSSDSVRLYNAVVQVDAYVARVFKYIDVPEMTSIPKVFAAIPEPIFETEDEKENWHKTIVCIHKYWMIAFLFCYYYNHYPSKLSEVEKVKVIGSTNRNVDKSSINTYISITKKTWIYLIKRYNIAILHSLYPNSAFMDMRTHIPQLPFDLEMMVVMCRADALGQLDTLVEERLNYQGKLGTFGSKCIGIPLIKLIEDRERFAAYYQQYSNAKEQYIGLVVSSYDNFSILYKRLHLRDVQESTENIHNLRGPIETLAPTETEASTSSGIVSENKATQEWSKLKGEDKATDVEEFQCTICMENSKVCIFMPCKHMVTCISCTNELLSTNQKFCPICKNNKVYPIVVYI